MVNNKSKPLLTILGLCGVLTTQAQESINASGADAASADGSVSYTIGQVAYLNEANSTNSINEGAQQPYEFFIVGIEPVVENMKLTAFPNPTVDNLTLEVSDYNREKMSYQLYDSQGRLLNEAVINGNLTPINTNHLLASTYFLRVLNAQQQTIQTFKIIKNSR